jgi:Trk-type K+ transport system membrane component
LWIDDAPLSMASRFRRFRNFTSRISEPSRWVIICLMFAGRIGPLAVVTVLSRPQRDEKVDLPEADPLIG